MGQVGGFDGEGCAGGGGGDGDVDGGVGLGREVGEEGGDAREGVAAFEEGVLGAHFGGPFVIGDW